MRVFVTGITLATLLWTGPAHAVGFHDIVFDVPQKTSAKRVLRHKEMSLLAKASRFLGEHLRTLSLRQPGLAATGDPQQAPGVGLDPAVSDASGLSVLCDRLLSFDASFAIGHHSRELAAAPRRMHGPVYGAGLSGNPKLIRLTFRVNW